MRKIGEIVRSIATLALILVIFAVLAPLVALDELIFGSDDW